jgi:uncharacterized damage-inducible protein DinB
MKEELSRFVVLFDRLVQYTEAWLDRMEPAKLDDWMPIENPSMRFGDRVGRITVKGLIVHTIVGERFWVRHLRDCAPGAEIPVPRDPETARRVSEGDFRAEAKRLHAENLGAVRGFGEEVLAKPVRFVGRDWTGMGLLWGMYAHRAFHIGNIDIYLRQSDVIAPEFFEFNPTQMA